MRDLLTPDVLDTYEGVAYLVDPAGMIISLGPRNWMRFAQENGAPDLTPEAVFGRDLFLLMGDAPLRTLYHKLHMAVLAGALPEARVTYRCDAPDKRRVMLMTLTRPTPRTVLYQSILLKEEQRRPLAFLNAPPPSSRRPSSRPLSQRGEVLQVCGLCAKVSNVALARGAWLEPEDYDQQGGSEAVTLRYTVCLACQTASA